MFFKKPNAQLSDWGTLRALAWDDRPVEWIVQSGQLDVRITHMLKTVSLGEMPGVITPQRDRWEWSVHGVMTYPKFIPVEITFEGDEKQFGGFHYNRQDNEDFNSRKINLPRL